MKFRICFKNISDTFVPRLAPVYYVYPEPVPIPHCYQKKKKTASNLWEMWMIDVFRK